MWYMGQYIMSALDATVCNAFRKSRSKGGKYVEKPFMQKSIEENKDNKYKNSQEEIAVIEMKKRSMRIGQYGLPQSP